MPGQNRLENCQRQNILEKQVIINLTKVPLPEPIVNVDPKRPYSPDPWIYLSGLDEPSSLIVCHSSGLESLGVLKPD